VSEPGFVGWVNRVSYPSDATKSNWGRQALRVMRDVWLEFCAEFKADGREIELSEARELVSRIDRAYPFGMRRYTPYKVWLAERRILKRALFDQLPAPTHEDLAAVEVAIDLAELGRIDEAEALLSEQAPRRHNRKCPACGADIGCRCRPKGEYEARVPCISRVAQR